MTAGSELHWDPLYTGGGESLGRSEQELEGLQAPAGRRRWATFILYPMSGTLQNVYAHLPFYRLIR